MFGHLFIDKNLRKVNGKLWNTNDDDDSTAHMNTDCTVSILDLILGTEITHCGLNKEEHQSQGNVTDVV